MIRTPLWHALSLKLRHCGARLENLQRERGIRQGRETRPTQETTLGGSTPPLRTMSASLRSASRPRALGSTLTAESKRLSHVHLH
jgi:hypothetical protein